MKVQMTENRDQHRLIIYRYMLDRWWKAILSTSIALFILAGGLGGLPLLLPEVHFLWVPDQTLWLVAGAGALAFIFSLFLIILRRKAYIQFKEDHLSLVTPFLKVKFPYEQIRRIYTGEIQQLFPANRTSKWQQSLLQPLANKVAIILELNGFPISRFRLQLFLSPLFFPDKTSRIVLLVPDGIKAQSELEALSGVKNDSQVQQVSIDQTGTHISLDPEKPQKHNIYFACSITGGRQYEALYQAIIKTLLEAGHEVPTAHLAETDVVVQEGAVDARQVYERDVNWIKSCDALIAEVSTPSHGVGYEIAYALAIGKPVFCIYQVGQKVSKMITGNSNANLRVVTYQDVEQAIIFVNEFISILKPNL